MLDGDSTETLQWEGKRCWRVSAHATPVLTRGIERSYQTDIKSCTMRLSYVTSASFFLLGIRILLLSTLQGYKCVTLKFDLGVVF